MNTNFTKKNGSSRTVSTRFLIILSLFLWFGCRSAEEKMQVFVHQLSPDFFEILPDSTRIFSGKIKAENALPELKLADFDQKKVDFTKKLADVQAIDADKLSPENQKIRLFLMEKIGRNLQSFDADLSIFETHHSLQYFWENPSKNAADRRADLEILLKKIPTFYASAKLIFFQKKGQNKTMARENAVKSWHFLVARRADFSQNKPLETAILATKDWIGFCESQ